MRNQMRTVSIVSGLTLLPATSALAAGVVGGSPPPPKPLLVTECSLPGALSFFCFLGF